MFFPAVKRNLRLWPSWFLEQTILIQNAPEHLQEPSGRFNPAINARWDGVLQR
jgi:hypothetical protein